MIKLYPSKADLEIVRNILAFWFQPDIYHLHKNVMEPAAFKELQDFHRSQQWGGYA